MKNEGESVSYSLEMKTKFKLCCMRMKDLAQSASLASEPSRRGALVEHAKIIIGVREGIFPFSQSTNPKQTHGKI